MGGAGRDPKDNRISHNHVLLGAFLLSANHGLGSWHWGLGAMQLRGPCSLLAVLGSGQGLLRPVPHPDDFALPSFMWFQLCLSLFGGIRRGRSRVKFLHSKELEPVKSDLGTQLSHAGTELRLNSGQAWLHSADPEGPWTFDPFSSQQLHFCFLGRQDTLHWTITSHEWVPPCSFWKRASL